MSIQLHVDAAYYSAERIDFFLKTVGWKTLM